MNYTITLTEAEDLALQYVAADPQDWIDNAATNRARIAIDEICTRVWYCSITNLISSRYSCNGFTKYR